jgi:hypothetical protein
MTDGRTFWVGAMALPIHREEARIVAGARTAASRRQTDQGSSKDYLHGTCLFDRDDVDRQFS